MRIVKTRDQDDLLRRYAEARRAEEESKNARLLLEEELMALLTKEQRKSAETEDGGKTYRVTYVQSETSQIDEDGLRKALGAATFRKYTVERLDRHKLEDGMDAGEVDPIVVGQFVSVKPSKPFLRFTIKEAGNTA